MFMKNKLKDLLKEKLTKRELEMLPNSFDIIGNILVFNDFPTQLKKKESLIGDVLLQNFKNVKTILKRTKKFSGEFRLPKFKIISGKRTKETIFIENKARIKTNLEKVYFSSRLGNERKRVFLQIKPNERILVMFSGSGIYPIVIAKNSRAKEIYGIELNPAAHKYAMENLKLNKIDKRIKFICGDVKGIVPKINKKFDRIIMPLPKEGKKFLYVALKKIKNYGIINLYDFCFENEHEKIIEHIQDECKNAGKKCNILNIVKCGQISPRNYRICVDFKVEKK